MSPLGSGGGSGERSFFFARDKDEEARRLQVCVAACIDELQARGTTVFCQLLRDVRCDQEAWVASRLQLAPGFVDMRFAVDQEFTHDSVARRAAFVCEIERCIRLIPGWRRGLGFDHATFDADLFLERIERCQDQALLGIGRSTGK